MKNIKYSGYRIASLSLVSIFFAIASAMSKLFFSGSALEVRLSFYLFYFFVSLIIGMACLVLSHLMSRKWLLEQKHINIIVPLMVWVILIFVCFLAFGSVSIIVSLVCMAEVYIIYFGNKYLYAFFMKAENNV
jgi:hypothetical protein